MKKSFARMEEEVQRWSQNNNETPSCRCELQTPHCDAVGSTAVVADVTPEKIMIANCGDTRAMLCRNNVAVPLWDDHKPDRPDELLRIEAAGGRVIYWDGARVLGVLALSRATVTNECEDSDNCYAQTKCINFPLRRIYHYFCPKINEGDGKTNVTDMQIPD